MARARAFLPLPLHCIATLLLVPLLVGDLAKIGVAATDASPKLSVDFYKRMCPRLSEIVKSRVTKTLAAGIVRIFAHDCLIKGGRNNVCGGCDASILLNNTGSENSARRNFPLAPDAFALVDQIKAAVELVCPGIVSCADILALSARHAITAVKGPDIPVPLGRKDTTAGAFQENAERCLSDHNSGVTQLTQDFSTVGLSQKDLVTLLGSHTIGKAHCTNIQDRLYATSGARQLDPTLDSKYANKVLYPTCPVYLSQPPASRAEILAEGETGMDPKSSVKFDNEYYKALKAGKGMFTSDSQLYLDTRTKAQVEKYAADEKAFFKDFSVAFVKMSQAGVLRGNEGVVRKVCWKDN